MTGDVEVQDPTPAMLDDKQTVQLLERDCRDSEEIECNDRLSMVPKKREPTLARICSAVHTPEIARNSSFGNLKSLCFVKRFEARCSVMSYKFVPNVLGPTRSGFGQKPRCY